MISREEALERIRNVTWRLSTTTVPLKTAHGRVLAEDVTSDVDIPPFDKSSMDGYACRVEDTFAPLRVLEHIAAGHTPSFPITPGTCSKIMTGAPVPSGADCILIVEQIRELDSETIQFTGTTTKSNICLCGEDVKVGAQVLNAGTRIGAAHVPVLASVGQAQPLVYQQPRVAIMATGDELVSPATKPSAGQIRNSNSLQLTTLAKGAGAQVVDLGIVSDDRETMTAAWADALETHDVILSTGGVSMGDYDFVPDILRHHGFDIHFDRVAIQPGKPVLFGTRENKACFGLSGNPVSSFLQFHLFVTPFLWGLQGYTYCPHVLPLVLGNDLTRKNGGREGWIPVRLDQQSQIQPLEFHGSAHIHAFTVADGLVAFPKGETYLEAGRVVPVYLLPD